MSWPSYPEHDYERRKRFGLYFDVREDAKCWGLRVHGIGSFTSQKDDISLNGRVLEQYALVLVTRGSGYFKENENTPNKLKAGDMISIVPNEWHLYNPDRKTGWETCWIIFDGPLAESLYQAGKIRFGVLVSEVEESGLQALGAIFQGMIKMAMGRQDTIELQARLAAELLGLIARIADWKNQQQRAEMSKDIGDAVSFVEQHFPEEIDFDELREKAGMSSTHFRRQFKSVAGDGPQTYQQRLRIRLARELLRHTDLTIAEVGQRVGYEKPAYFSRLFKTKVGMSPIAWRKSGAFAVE